MTELRNDGTPEKEISFADALKVFRNVVLQTTPHLPALTIFEMMKGAVWNLQHYITKGKGGISWKAPYVRLIYDAPRLGREVIAALEQTEEEAVEAEKLKADLKAEVEAGKDSLKMPREKAVAILEYMTAEYYEGLKLLIFQNLTSGLVVGAKGIIAPRDSEAWKILQALPEAEREAKAQELAAGYEWPAIKASGTIDTPTGKLPCRFSLKSRLSPLTLRFKKNKFRAFFEIIVGLDFTEGDPSAWPEEAQQKIFESIFAELDKLAAPYLKETEAKGETRPEIPKPNQVLPGRSDYFKTSGRLFDTPRHAAAKQETLPVIAKWYQQTAFNRTVGMAAAALTKAKTREAVLEWQSATVEEVEDLVFCRSEEGSPAHGQHREDIVRAFEALRAIPIPIVRIDWQSIGTGKNTRWRKTYTLRVASMLQSYGAVYVDRKTGKEVFPEDPDQAAHRTKAKASRRKKTQALIESGEAKPLQAFPADKYKLTRFEWRWNTDIAEDFICPKVALDEKSNPRLKPMGKCHHIEGSRFVMLHIKYFAIQKRFREGNLTYAPRLLDYIVSEVKDITSRGKGIVWFETSAPKVIKYLGLWEEYQSHSKHVLEDHIKPAIEALIREKVLLSESDINPRIDPNPDRRKGDFYRWKVAELWSTVALVSDAEAKEIETEQLTTLPAEQEINPQPEPKAEQTALPGMEPPALPIPSGVEIRAVREAAGVNLRDFARLMGGPSFKTWALYETGQRGSRTVRHITPETWQKVRDFITLRGQNPGNEKGA